MSKLFMILNKSFWKSFITPPGKMGSTIELKLYSGIHLLLKMFLFVNHSVDNSFTNKSTRRCDFQWEIFYRHLMIINSNIDFIINSIDFRYNLDNKTCIQSSAINRCLSAINSNVDFIINSIDFWYNMDNKTYMQSSAINSFIGG